MEQSSQNNMVQKQQSQEEPVIDASRKLRVLFKPHQQATLESIFEKRQYISALERETLSLTLDVSVERIKIWFQNRRMREKNKAREVKNYYKKRVQRKGQSQKTSNGKSYCCVLSRHLNAAINDSYYDGKYRLECVPNQQFNTSFPGTFTHSSCVQENLENGDIRNFAQQEQKPTFENQSLFYSSHNRHMFTSSCLEPNPPRICHSSAYASFPLMAQSNNIHPIPSFHPHIYASSTTDNCPPIAYSSSGKTNPNSEDSYHSREFPGTRVAPRSFGPFDNNAFVSKARTEDSTLTSNYGQSVNHFMHPMNQWNSANFRSENENVASKQPLISQYHSLNTSTCTSIQSESSGYESTESDNLQCDSKQSGNFWYEPIQSGKQPEYSSNTMKEQYPYFYAIKQSNSENFTDYQNGYSFNEHPYSQKKDFPRQNMYQYPTFENGVSIEKLPDNSVDVNGNSHDSYSRMQHFSPISPASHNLSPNSQSSTLSANSQYFPQNEAGSSAEAFIPRDVMSFDKPPIYNCVGLPYTQVCHQNNYQFTDSHLQ